MDEVKLALDKAAASPDPAVRNMALQYVEARSKLSSLEAFFAFYAEGSGALNGRAHAAAKPHDAPAAHAAPERARPPARVRATPSGAGEKTLSVSAKAAEFTRNIVNIIRQSNAPIKQEALQMAYEALSGESLASETFRQRMHSQKKRGAVVLIPRVGYWLPETEGNA